MAKAGSSIDLSIPAGDVWRLIGGFGSLPDWLPNIVKSVPSEGGRLRNLTTADGVVLTERLLTFDEAGRRYTYGIVQSPFPQTGYLSTIRVTELDGGQGARVEWFGEFSPAGVSEAEITAAFQALYENGLKALTARYAIPVALGDD